METSESQWLQKFEKNSTGDAEAEQEAAWLRAVGMGSAVEQYEKGEFIDKHTVKQQLSFLTHQQRAAVQKRVATLNRTLRKRRRTIRSDTEVLYGSSASADRDDSIHNNVQNESNQSCKDSAHEKQPAFKYQTSFIDHDLTLGAPVQLASALHNSHESPCNNNTEHLYHEFNGRQSKKNPYNLPYPLAHNEENQSNPFDDNSNSHWTHFGHGFNDGGGDIQEKSGLELEEDFFDLIDADIDNLEEEEDHYVEDEDTSNKGTHGSGEELESKVCLDLTADNQTKLSPFRNSLNHSKDQHSSVLPTSIPPEHLHSIQVGSNKENDGLHANKNDDCFGTSSNHIDVDCDVRGARSIRLLSTGGLFPRVSLASRERKNGVAVLYDLSLTDVARLNTLSFLQLTSIFDTFNIPLSIPKKTPKSHSKSSSPIFGRSLSFLVEEEMKHDQYQYVIAPRFIKELVKHLINGSLREEGILRKAGNSSRIKNYRQIIDQSFNSKPFPWHEVQIHDAASLLKQYLMELPVPILTFEYMHFFPLICKMNCKLSKKLEALNLLVLMLPVSHSHTLKLLLIYLDKVTQNERHNRMNLENIAKIMAPTFFGTSFDAGNRSKNAKPLGSMDDEIKNIEDQQEVLQLLIYYHEQLWIIPDFLLSECRHRNQMATDKQKSLPVLKNFFKRSARRESVDHSDSASALAPCTTAPSSAVITANNNSSFLPRQLNVCLSHNTTVYVDTEMCPTVGDVMEYIKKGTGPINKMSFSSNSSATLCSSSSSAGASDAARNNPSSDSSRILSTAKCSPQHGASGGNATSYSQDGWIKAITGDPSKKLYLFEVGGNIAKRCLSDENASMSNLISMNPGATWTVEFR